jgi:hypothetical protein
MFPLKNVTVDAALLILLYHQALNFFSSACLEANFLMLRQGKLILTLWAFGITALHRGRAA